MKIIKAKNLGKDIVLKNKEEMKNFWECVKGDDPFIIEWDGIGYLHTPKQIINQVEDGSIIVSCDLADETCEEEGDE